MDWKSVALLIGFLVFWFALNRWILPRFGVPTCMSGACGVDRRPTVAEGTGSVADEPRRLAGDREDSSGGRLD